MDEFQNTISTSQFGSALIGLQIPYDLDYRLDLYPHCGRIINVTQADLISDS